MARGRGRWQLPPPAKRATAAVAAAPAAVAAAPAAIAVAVAPSLPAGAVPGLAASLPAGSRAITAAVTVRAHVCERVLWRA